MLLQRKMQFYQITQPCFLIGALYLAVSEVVQAMMVGVWKSPQVIPKMVHRTHLKNTAAPECQSESEQKR